MKPDTSLPNSSCDPLGFTSDPTSRLNIRRFPDFCQLPLNFFDHSLRNPMYRFCQVESLNHRGCNTAHRQSVGPARRKQ